MASQNAVKAGEAYVELNADDSRFQRVLRRVVEKIRRAGAMLRRIGSQMTAGGAALGVAMAPAVATFVKFDDAILAVRAVTGATADEFAALRGQALELGRTTSFTASEVANLMTELGRAGFNPAQIENMTGSVLNLARATGTEAAQAAGIMSATIRQFGMEASQATRVADALTTAANKSFNTVESLGESLSYAGPVAADFNMSLEDTLAILGALGNVGIQGSNAGTAVRRLLTLTGAEADKLKDIFGVTFVDAAGNARPLVDVLDEVNKATADLGTSDRAKKFNEAFGLLGITGASAISKNVVSVRELRKALAEAEGTAAKTAEMMDSGAGGSLRRLQSAAEGVAISLGDALAPVLDVVGKNLTSLIGMITEWVNENKGLARVIGILAIALVGIGIPLAAFGFLITGATTAVTAFIAVLSLLAGIIGAVFSPTGLLLVGIGAAIVAFVKFTDVGKKAAEGVMGAFRQIGAFIGKVFGGIRAAVEKGDLKTAWAILRRGLEIAWRQAMITLRVLWNSFTNFFYDLFWDVLIGLRKAWAQFTTWIAQKMTVMVKTVIVPILEATDWVGITEGAADRFKGRAAEIEKALGAMGQQEVNALNKQLEATKAGRRRAQDLDLRKPRADLANKIHALNLLIEAANAPPVPVAPMPRPGGPPVAPMPHAPGGMPARPVEERFGDAVRGLFQSADFQGRLAIGPAAKDVSKQQLDVMKNVAVLLKAQHETLRSIDRKANNLGSVMIT